MPTLDRKISTSLDRYLTTPPEWDDEFDDYIARICSCCFCNKSCSLYEPFFNGGLSDDIVDRCLIVKEYLRKMEEEDDYMYEMTCKYEKEMRQDYIKEVCQKILYNEMYIEDAASCIDETIESMQQIYDEYVGDLIFDMTILPNMKINASWGKPKTINGESYYDFDVFCAMLDAEKFDVTDGAFIHLIVRSYAFAINHVTYWDSNSTWLLIVSDWINKHSDDITQRMMQQARDHPDTIEALYG